jgi:hypothetical protein
MLHLFLKFGINSKARTIGAGGGLLGTHLTLPKKKKEKKKRTMVIYIYNKWVFDFKNNHGYKL